MSLYDDYRDIKQALESKKFIIVARKKAYQRKTEYPKSLTKRVLEQIDRWFADGFHYVVEGISNDEGSSSNIEIVSKYKNVSPEEAAKMPAMADPTTRIVPTIEQFRFLFDDLQLI